MERVLNVHWDFRIVFDPAGLRVGACNRVAFFEHSDRGLFLEQDGSTFLEES